MPVWSRGVLVALSVVALTLPVVPGPTGRDLLQTAVEAGCLALAWHHVLRRRAVLVLGWGRLVAAVSVLALSDLVGVLERDVWHLASRPAVSNLVAMVGYVMLGLAVLKLDHHRSRGRRMPGRIEAAIFATGVLTPVLVFLVIPVLERESMSTGAKVVTIAYALADLVVVGVIARLLLTDGTQSRAFAYLSASLFTSLTGDIWSWTAGDAASPGPLAPQVQLLWLAGFVLFAAGMAHPSVVTFTEGGAWTQDAPRRRRVWLLGLGQAMPAIALVFAWATGQTSSILVIAIGGLVVSLLVSARTNGLLDRISAQSSQLSDQARSDELTGLHNRRSWNFELARACESAAADGGRLAVALLDLDHFKRYNDSYGHPAGDRLLQAATKAWQEALRPGEVLARYGGEEFAMLVPGVSLDEALVRVDSLREITPGGQTFSAGVTMWRPGTEPEQAVTDADSALYQAKRRGRDQVAPFVPPEQQPGSQLPFAMRTVVQPIVRVADLAIVAYEALTRFDPSTDVEAIFRQAHTDGYGDVLESSAILSALRHPGLPEEVELFVNVSERAMRSPLFWQSVPDRLDGVVMELHEGRDGLDDTAVSQMLGRFRERGARICLDDLVASQDDLDRVVSLRPDMVKLDRSLVAGCADRPEQLADIARLLRFSSAYGAEVCAEGVETPEELVALLGLGVPYVQGFLLGRPDAQWAEPLQPAVRLGAYLDAQDAPVSEPSAR